MSRIATLTAVLTMLVAPAAFAGAAHEPNINDIGKQAPPAVIDLRSPDAVNPVQPAGQDLRSPDARDVFVSPRSAPQAAPDGGGSDWGIIALIAGALVACAALAVMLRRRLQVGRPVGV